MGHGNSDRLYVTHDEMSGVYGNHTASGGQRVRASDVGFQRLPFDCCALSFQPWSIPVCDASEGTLFELTNILPFLKKHGVNPATGTPLQGKDLLRVHFFKNQNDKFHDPVSFKEFNEHSHIVVIKTSGNVFSYETVQQLNIKVKHLHDLIDDTPFTKKDVVTLQDPHNVEGRDINQLHHVQKGLKWAKEGTTEEEVNADATGSAGKILRQMRDAKERKEEGETSKDRALSASTSASTSASVKGNVPYNATNTSTGMMAASFTSSGLDVQTKSERVLINEEEYMFEKVAAGEGISRGKSKGKTKAYVRMETNFGPLNLELHVDKAPKTCYNFLELAKAGKYTDTIFHRNIKGFMIQGGDPTSTGRGGESIWGNPFRDEFDVQGAFRHTHRGVLSMANKGPGTNGSQFFFSYRDRLPHLDAKHTVFGRALGNGDEEGKIETLDKMESVPTEEGTDRPLRSIRILKVYILENPFDEWKENLQRRQARENMSESEQRQRQEKKRRREEDRTTWLGTNLGEKGSQDGNLPSHLDANQSGSGVGKYLAAKPKPATVEVASSAGRLKKQRGTNGSAAAGFGDFSSW